MGDSVSAFITLQGFRYHYVTWQTKVTGGEKSPVVLLHGFAQNASSWQEVAAILARERTVYALDLIGHGRSERPEIAEAYALSTQANALNSFTEFVTKNHEHSHQSAFSTSEKVIIDDEGEGVVVVGYSMGGRVALAAAIQSTVSWGGLVLESVGLGLSSNEDREAATQRDARSAYRLREGGVAAFMDSWEQLPLFASQKTLPVNVREQLAKSRRANNAEALARSFEEAGQHVMPNQMTVLDAIANFSFPLLYFAGDADAKYSALAQLLEKMQGKPSERTSVQVQIMPGLGHNMHLENPASFSQALQTWLDGM